MLPTVALLAAEKVQDRQCPLCLKTTNGKRKDFATHVGKHMEAIALAALPKEPESDVDHSSQSGLDEESGGRTPSFPAAAVKRFRYVFDRGMRVD